MEPRSKKPTATTKQQDLLRIDFSYAVGALPIDIVENIIALRPHIVNQPGKNFDTLSHHVTSKSRYTVSS